jgi:hypothetical protein
MPLTKVERDLSGVDQNYSVDAYESDVNDMDQQQPPGTNVAPVPQFCLHWLCPPRQYPV